MLQNEPQPRNQPDALTWNAIIADEPFTGEHWEGILTERDSYGGSPTSLSPYSSDPDDDDESSSPFYALEKPSQPPSEPETSLKQPQFRPSHAYAHRWELEDIQARQYWRSPIEGPLGNASNENSVPACDVGNPANLGILVLLRCNHLINGRYNAETYFHPGQFYPLRAAAIFKCQCVVSPRRPVIHHETGVY